MPKSTTKEPKLSPLARAQDLVTQARQRAGGEDRELTSDDRKQIVVDLSKALRALNEVERDYVPKESKS